MKNSAWVYCVILITVVASFAGETNNESVRSAGTDRQTFSVGPTSVSIDVPAGWQSAEGLYGIDLMILGPEVAGDRPVVSVIDLGESPAIELDDPKSDEQEYRTGREEWLAAKEGKFIKLIPLRIDSIADAKGFTVGYRYSLEGKEYTENTWYVVCKGNAYNLKTLVPLAAAKDSLPTINKIITGFSCQ